MNEIADIKQVQVIFYKHHIIEREAKSILKDANGKLDLIKQCYEYTLDKDVPNIVGYMRILVRGFNEPQGNIKVGEFNNYEQRKYDFDELEKRLLGYK
jgi:plasmid replication initiation protein